jgi:hypothetical protein
MTPRTLPRFLRPRITLEDRRRRRTSSLMEADRGPSSGMVALAEQQCPVCGRHFFAKTGQHTYCRFVVRARSRGVLARSMGSGISDGGICWHRRVRWRARDAMRGSVRASRGTWATSAATRHGTRAQNTCGATRDCDPEHRNGKQTMAEYMEQHQDDPEQDVFGGPPGYVGRR